MPLLLSILPHLLFLELRAHDQHREGGREERSNKGKEGGKEGGSEGGSEGVREEGREGERKWSEGRGYKYRQQVQCMHITGSYIYTYCTHSHVLI